MRAVKMFPKSPTIFVIIAYNMVVKIASGVFALVTGVNLILLVHNVIMQIIFLYVTPGLHIMCLQILYLHDGPPAWLGTATRKMGGVGC